MRELIAGLIDVFADEPLTGNPLAVVEGADELNDEQMRRIAREFNQAETTFILESTRCRSEVTVLHCKRCRGLWRRA
jgi:PhzF family phenazine biosynthesis protein